MKYFVTSDIHSFGSYLIRDLAAAGYDKDNPDHILIICGDIFDRGPDTLLVYEFLRSIPVERLKLVYGNHERLYTELLDKDFPDSYDFHNGTVKTFCQIADASEKLLDKYYVASVQIGLKDFCASKLESTLHKNWKQIVRKVKKSEITKFIENGSWLNYFELPNYVFVHSFIPIKIKEEFKAAFNSFELTASSVGLEFCEYDQNWRNAYNYQWEEAAWGCPWKQFKAGLFTEDKQLVVGHWHTSDFFNNLDGELRTPEQCDIYNNHGLIALDACAVINKKLNIFIIED